MTGFNRIQGATGLAGIDRDGNPVGDLTGSYPGPIVKGLQTYPIDPRVPANGETLVFNGGEWIPTPAPTSVTFFQGVWDANANNPDIANFPGLDDGFLWIVSVAGNTILDGIGNWLVGDYALYSNGNWYKLANKSFGWGLTGNDGTNPNINYVGTSDEHDFSLRTNEQEVLRLYYGKGAYLSGSLTIDTNLVALGNMTGSNMKLTGDLAVCGGDITSNSSIFNLLTGVTTRINIGNSSVCNWISGSTKFPQGVSGSLTQLVDGTSYLVAGKGMIILSCSNGSVKLSVNDSVFATLSGSVFSGPVVFNAGLSGSLTNLADGTSYILGATNTLVTTGSNGSITISTPAAGLDTQVQFNDGGVLLGANSGLTYNKATNSLTVSGNEAVNGGNLTTSASTFNLVNSTATTVNFAGGATSALNLGNTAATNTFSGATKFPQGLSGSLTKLTDGTSAFIQGVGILVTSASNGPVTITMSNTGSAGTYGSASQVPVFSTDAQGRVTAVTNTSIAISAAQVVSGTFPNSVSVQNIYQNVTSQVSGGATPLAYGEVIYFTTSGGSAANPAIDRASAAVAATAATTIGLVSSTSIPNGTTGQIITRGVLVGNPLGSPPYLNTNGFTQGDLLYVDPTTPGALTNVRPSYPNFAIPVGIVIVKNQYTGAIYVDPSVGYNAADVVKIPAPSAKRTESAPGTTSILSTWFNGPPAISYLALDFNGAGNVTLSAGPIQAQTAADYGRILWIHNVSTKTVTFNSGGTTYLSGGVNLVLQPNSLVQFMWSFVGGGAGRWLQMGAPITVS